MTQTYWPRAMCSPATTAVLRPPLRSAPWRSRVRIDRFGLGEVEEQLAGVVVAVVDETDLERRGSERGGDPVHQRPDVVRLVACGNDQADGWRTATRPFGSHRHRIGANRRGGHRLSPIGVGAAAW